MGQKMASAKEPLKQLIATSTNGQLRVTTAFHRHANAFFDGHLNLDEIPDNCPEIQLVINLEVARRWLNKTSPDRIVLADMRRKQLEISKYICEPFANAYKKLTDWVNDEARVETDRSAIEAAVILKWTHCLISFGYSVQRGIGKKLAPLIGFDEAMACAFILGSQSTLVNSGEFEATVEGKLQEKVRKSEGQMLRRQAEGTATRDEVRQVMKEIVSTIRNSTGKVPTPKIVKPRVRGRFAELGRRPPGEKLLKTVVKQSTIDEICSELVAAKLGA
jgi:hypothetical protein